MAFSDFLESLEVSAEGVRHTGPTHGRRRPPVLSQVFLLVPGTHSSIDNQLSLLSLSARRAIAMPLSYVVEAFGRTGAELRVARGAHDLIATGASSRLGLLLPGHTTTTVVTPDGRPLEVRLPFLLASWLLLGTLTVHVQVGVLLVYEHMIGAERLGAALDLLLGALTNNEPLTPSVLRRHLLRLAATMRPDVGEMVAPPPPPLRGHRELTVSSPPGRPGSG